MTDMNKFKSRGHRKMDNKEEMLSFEYYLAFSIIYLIAHLGNLILNNGHV